MGVVMAQLNSKLDYSYHFALIKDTRFPLSLIRRILFIPLFIILFISSSLITTNALSAEDGIGVKHIKKLMGIIMDDIERYNKGNIDEKKEIHDSISKFITDNFDFNIMAKKALGINFDTLEQYQQNEFIELFKSLFQDAYTRLVLQNLKRWPVIYEKDNNKDGNILVFSIIMRPNDPLPIEYTIRKDDLHLIDFNVQGVSVLHTYQVSFANEIRLNGVAGLLNSMRRQFESLE